MPFLGGAMSNEEQSSRGMPDVPADHPNPTATGEAKAGASTAQYWAPTPGPTGPNGSASVADHLPTRVCPACSTQERTTGAFCPHCGARYERKRSRVSKRVKIVLASLVTLLLLGAAGAGVAMKLHHDHLVKQRQAAAARRVAAQRRAAAARAEAKKTEDHFKLAERKDTVKSLEHSVTKDAQKDVNDGLLDGPILRTECSPASGTDISDLSASTGDFTCLAVNKDNLSSGTSSGYRFTATVNYNDGTYTWHLGG